MQAGAQPQAQSKPPMPPEPPARIKDLADRVIQRFPGAKVEYIRAKRLKLLATPEEIKSVALFVRDELGFDHIGTVSGTDYMAKGEIEVVYFVGCLSRPGYQDVILAVAERQKRENPVVPSLVEVWPGTEYHEREAYEMLGVNFQGHPDLRRLLLPEDWNDLPPLRKDYNSPGR